MNEQAQATVGVPSHCLWEGGVTEDFSEELTAEEFISIRQVKKGTYSTLKLIYGHGMKL